MSQTATRTAKDIADEALDAVGYGQEQSKWLSALIVAIRLDARHNNGRNVADLASLGQYLADDCANYLEAQSGTLRRQLKAVGGAQ